jgi:tetratricopeptide (TPR) repeat protein
VTEYQAAIALTSDTGLLAQTFANLGAAQRSLGDDTKARYSFEESLRLNPNQYNAWLGLGLLSQKQGELQEAILDLSRSVELQPTAQGYFQLGKALQQTSRPAEALNAFEEALKISPDMAEAQHATDELRVAH